MIKINFKLPFSGLQYDNCQSAFMSVKDLTSHIRTDCNEDSLKRFKCYLCPYSTNHKSHINSHSLVHSGERPHVCEVCHRGFALPKNLRRHMLLHTGEKPYSCSVCNTSFRHAQSLKLHMITKHL